MQKGPDRAYIQSLFAAVAPTYDILNTIISFGLHRFWKKRAVQMTAVPKNGRALDVCSGTGDLAELLADCVGPNGLVVGVDFCQAMLERAVKRIRPKHQQIRYTVLGDALSLPFADNSFDAATVAFGLRNVENMEIALREMARVVRPGGRVVCLDLSRPTNPLLSKIYFFYFRNLLPWIGGLVHGVVENYAYLPASLDRFPSLEEIRSMMLSAGIKDVKAYPLSGGIVAIHCGVVAP